MLHELRIYTLKTGAAPQAAKNSGEVGRNIRGDDYGKLLGYWLPEIGPLNQVMHLWGYESYAERERLRGALGKNERWTGEYLPLMRPILLRQDIRLLNPIIAPATPAEVGNIYEFRYYRLQPGAMKRWVELFTKVLPIREKYSKIVGLWNTEAGQPNEVCHIWAYKSFGARMEARHAASQDPAWQAYLKEGGQLIDEMNSVLMLPSAHSPLQ
jgi:hypothetical protein